jgi:hypothetical protein
MTILFDEPGQVYLLCITKVGETGLVSSPLFFPTVLTDLTDCGVKSPKIRKPTLAMHGSQVDTSFIWFVLDSH